MVIIWEGTIVFSVRVEGGGRGENLGQSGGGEVGVAVEVLGFLEGIVRCVVGQEEGYEMG
jgi:hypothetical protein